MKVSVDDVAARFSSLLEGKRTREEVADWALAVRRADDGGLLNYLPPSAEQAIWQALEYLEGADLKDGPDTYLHNDEDHRAAQQSDRAIAHRGGSFAPAPLRRTGRGAG